MTTRILQLTGISHTYYQGGVPLEVLRNVNLTIQRGEIIALVGPSGSGKSTLLHISGLLERPKEGVISILDSVSDTLNDNVRTKIRSKNMGFVYQHHHLLGDFTAIENIILPQLISGKTRNFAERRAQQLLDMMGLKSRASHRPSQLSGGEQQRVAVGRALANEPQLLLADEPTGNLDPESAGDVFSLLLDLVKETGVAALIATHNPELAQRMDRIVYLENGELLAR